jgi:hypothetical protein
VIELRNDSGAMHLVRLAAGGHVVQGVRLDGYYTSRPCVRNDGTVVFFRCGLMYAARDLSIDETLAVFHLDAGVFSTAVVEGDDCVYVGVTKNGPYNPWSMDPLISESQLLRVDL